MELSRPEAAAALRDIDSTTRRSATLRGYQSAAPHLLMWGGLWLLGYGGSFLLPGWASTVWPVILLGGGLGDFLIARHVRQPRQGRLVLAVTAAMLVFIVASLAVLRPPDPRQVAAFIPLVIALGYVILGLAIGWRLIATGIGLAALTLFGFFALPGWFVLWMAFIGGGALVLGGLWLRRA
jgi:hypothetical protein